MKRLLLLASAATLAIAAPALAGPHGGRGGGGGGGGAVMHVGGGGGGGGGRAAFRGGGGGGHAAFRAPMAAPHFAARGGGRATMRGGGGGPRMMAARQRGGARMTARGGHARPTRTVAQRQVRTHTRQAARANVGTNHGQTRMQARANRAQQNRMIHANQARQAQMAARQMHGPNAAAQARMAARQQMRGNGQLKAQNRMAMRQQLAGPRVAGMNNGVGYGVGGCPPGLGSKGCMPPGQAILQNRAAVQQQLMGIGGLSPQQRIAAIQGLGANRFMTLNGSPRMQILDPLAASALVGVPLATAAAIGTFGPVPEPIAYLYPPTPNYYYQYGNGYVYQIDRTSSLIAALFPLLAGGYMPGTYLPAAYMTSYVPDYYGYNAFYPASYGYGLCNRYAYGVIYQVDCFSGMVENVIPTYAGGYGVGQMLPAAYSYYNVPYQYRNLYYNTSSYGYWYAPGAIYQYDPASSMITSVAALLSPGFTVGQPLPVGYSVYNVPYAYRSTYYDTPNAWYRYSDGYIYRVDPTTMLVTAMVASALS